MKFITLTLLTLLFTTVQVSASEGWYKNKKHIGNAQGFGIYLVRTEESALNHNYSVELRGKNRGCKALKEEKYIDMRWGGYLYKCKDIKNGLVITPSTRSGKRMLANIVERTRSGDYIEVTGITTNPITSKL